MTSDATASRDSRAAAADAFGWLRGRASLLGWILLSRAVVFGTTVLLTSLREPRGHFSDAVLDRRLGPLAAWDGRWYGEVAQHGYAIVPGEKSSAAFFPLYPWLVAGFRSAFGVEPLTAGLVVANVLFGVAIVALYELGRVVVAEPIAHRAAVFAAISPLSFVFSMFYAESLALAAIALAGLAATRGRWPLAAVLAAAAALARPGGIFVAIPIAGLALKAWPTLSSRSRLAAATAVVAAPLGLAIFSLDLWHATGDPLAWMHAQAAWGRSLSLAGLGRITTGLPETARADLWVLRDVTIVAVSALLLVAARAAGVDRWWVGAGALMALLPLASGTWESAGRFGMIAPPVYWGLGALAGRRGANAATRVVLLAALVLGTLTLGLVNP